MVGNAHRYRRAIMGWEKRDDGGLEEKELGGDASDHGDGRKRTLEIGRNAHMMMFNLLTGGVCSLWMLAPMDNGRLDY